MKKIIITFTAAVIATATLAEETKLWVHSHSGNHLSIDIADVDSISFTEPSSNTMFITDICSNNYKCVKIGSQWWMAENMRCNKYDTRSGRAGAILSMSSSKTHAPSYTDASNKDNWTSTEFSESLSNDQIAKLGYLYEWAAAVGFATTDDAKNQTSSFSGNRQGICPNGWHVPTDAEWTILEEFIGSDVGKNLKTTSGWFDGGNGTDAFSFAALPAGRLLGNYIFEVGASASFWTATPASQDNAFYRTMESIEDGLIIFGTVKSFAHSVRCVKD